MSIFERNLERTPANYVPLSPVSFLTRAARIYPDRIAVIHAGRLSAAKPVGDWTLAAIGLAMAGGSAGHDDAH